MNDAHCACIAHLSFIGTMRNMYVRFVVFVEPREQERRPCLYDMTMTSEARQCITVPLRLFL